jgi:hypothetical protein
MSRPRLKSPWAKNRKPRPEAEQLRPQLESTRLELRALYRALDGMRLAQQLPVQLRQLQELDADLAEALYVLDRPPRGLDWQMMIDDTRGSLARVAGAREAFLATFDASTRTALEECMERTRGALAPSDAYLDIPGRDPAARRPRWPV